MGRRRHQDEDLDALGNSDPNLIGFGYEVTQHPSDPQGTLLDETPPPYCKPHEVCNLDDIGVIQRGATPRSVKEPERNSGMLAKKDHLFISHCHLLPTDTARRTATINPHRATVPNAIGIQAGNSDLTKRGETCHCQCHARRGGIRFSDGTRAGCHREVGHLPVLVSQESSRVA